MTHLTRIISTIARLLDYPDEHTAQAVEMLYVVLHSDSPDLARAVSRFGAFVEQHDPWELEEAFTRTFDVNPACALEVGWHLFGEEYARGMFLVRMREEMRKHGLPESAELPDHLSHVLGVVAVMSDEDATRFVRACVQPAVEKMNQALQKTDSPYRHVIECLSGVLRQQWGAGAGTASPPLESPPEDRDLLRAFPVAEADCGGNCGGSCGSVDVVSLESSCSAANRDAGVSSTAPERKS